MRIDWFLGNGLVSLEGEILATAARSIAFRLLRLILEKRTQVRELHACPNSSTWLNTHLPTCVLVVMQRMMPSILKPDLYVDKVYYGAFPVMVKSDRKTKEPVGMTFPMRKIEGPIRCTRNIS